MLIRVFRYPASPMLVLIVIYGFVRVASDDRTRIITLLSMSAIGVTEVLLATLAVIRERGVRNTLVISHVLVAAGASTIGFSLLEPIREGVLALGSLLLGAGLLIHQLNSENPGSLDR